MGQQSGALAGATIEATLKVQGRECAARPMRGTALGSAGGLCVLVDSPEALRQAIAWIPGRILVLDSRCLAGALEAPGIGETFAAVVVLCDDRATLERIGPAPVGVPAVFVERTGDQEVLRHAIRATVTVQLSDRGVPSLPVPRRPPRSGKHRRGSVPVGHRVPGTIDLRPHRGAGG